MNQRERIHTICDFVEIVLRFVPEREHRPRYAIEAARKYADEPTQGYRAHVQAAAEEAREAGCHAVEGVAQAAAWAAEAVAWMAAEESEMPKWAVKSALKAVKWTAETLSRAIKEGVGK